VLIFSDNAETKAMVLPTESSVSNLSSLSILLFKDGKSSNDDDVESLLSTTPIAASTSF
jgi:hypothetical protein